MEPKPRPMGNLERDNKGRFEASHELTAEDVYQAMKSREPYTTSELAEYLGAPRRTVFHYLDILAEEGKIQKKQPAETRVIWIRGS